MDLEGLPRLGFDPFSIDVSYILLEKRRIVQLARRSAKGTGCEYGLWGQGERVVCSDLGPWRMF